MSTLNTVALPGLYDKLMAAELKVDGAYTIRTTLASYGFSQAVIDWFTEYPPKELNPQQIALGLTLDQNIRQCLPHNELAQFDAIIQLACANWKASHRSNRNAQIITDYLIF